MSTSTAVEAHSVSSVSLGTRLVLTTFVGRTTSALSERAYEEFRTLITPLWRPVWVSDASRLTGFEPRSLAVGPRWFSAFKERGGRECLVVTRWDVAMMAASTMALGLGIRIRTYPTLDAALADAELMLRSE